MIRTYFQYTQNNANPALFVLIRLTEINGIQAIHDLHIWQLSGERIVASVHVKCEDAETYLTIVQRVKLEETVRHVLSF